jgi:hypothetical protein
MDVTFGIRRGIHLSDPDLPCWDTFSVARIGPVRAAPVPLSLDNACQDLGILEAEIVDAQCWRTIGYLLGSVQPAELLKQTGHRHQDRGDR